MHSAYPLGVVVDSPGRPHCGAGLPGGHTRKGDGLGRPPTGFAIVGLARPAPLGGEPEATGGSYRDQAGDGENG
jgi:hypothetical protein